MKIQRPQQPNQPPSNQQPQPHDHQQPPPHYASTTPQATHHHLTRPSPFTSRVHITCATGITRYTFAPSSERVYIHAGSSTSNPALGYLAFPKQHNAFRLHFATHPDPDIPKEQTSFSFTDVRARVGYPHPSTFSFKSSVSGRAYVWRNCSPGGDGVPVRYELVADDGSGGLVATLVVGKRSRGGTGIWWARDVGSELEQAFLVLSAVGVVTRLSRKGMYRDEKGGGSGRWFAFWWYAIMMTAAVG